MPDFMAKMHQIRIQMELRPTPSWGAYSAPLGLAARFKRPHFSDLICKRCCQPLLQLIRSSSCRSTSLSTYFPVLTGRAIWAVVDQLHQNNRSPADLLCSTIIRGHSWAMLRSSLIMRWQNDNDFLGERVGKKTEWEEKGTCLMKS